MKVREWCRLVAGIVMAGAVAGMGFAESVTNVRGVQRENSHLVDIYYDLEASEGNSYFVEIQIEGRTSEVAAATFTGDVGDGITSGKNHHVIWDAGADWPDRKGDVRVVVTTFTKGKHNKVQLWAGGPYWATTNIGATEPWEAGLYFWWGDTTGYRPSSDGTFSFDFASDNAAIYTWDKSFAELQGAGWVTAGSVLALAHDAAHVKWGGNWRMPTQQEFLDLINKCDWTWKSMNGVYGYVVCGRDDYASKSIFLPCAGYGLGTSLSGAGSRGGYWSSVPLSDNNLAWGLYFYSSRRRTSNSGRRVGQSVRPVQGFTN